MNKKQIKETIRKIFKNIEFPVTVDLEGYGIVHVSKENDDLFLRLNIHNHRLSYVYVFLKQPHAKSYELTERDLQDKEWTKETIKIVFEKISFELFSIRENLKTLKG